MMCPDGEDCVSKDYSKTSDALACLNLPPSLKDVEPDEEQAACGKDTGDHFWGGVSPAMVMCEVEYIMNVYQLR